MGTAAHPPEAASQSTLSLLPALQIGRTRRAAAAADAASVARDFAIAGTRLTAAVTTTTTTTTTAAVTATRLRDRKPG